MDRSVSRLVAVAALSLGLAAVPAVAQAAITARASIETKSGRTRLVVKLSSPTALTVRRRPTKVSVKVGRKTYALSRVRGASAAVVSLGTWRSAGYTGAAATAIKGLAGKRVSVIVTAQAGTTSLGSAIPKATVPKPIPKPGPTPVPTPGPLFTPPGKDLTGQAALDSIKGYVYGSRFTDCVAGWPNCSVEERYSFCPNGTSGAYQRLTPSSGSDIRSFGAIQIFGADQKADGSWAISLAFLLNGKTPGVDPPSFYTWTVGQNGIANGLYWAPPGDPRNGDPASQSIGPLQYARGVGSGDC